MPVIDASRLNIPGPQTSAPSPAPAPGELHVQVTSTLGGVLTDLVEVAEWLPVPPSRAETAARILDRLAEEIAEAASLLRQLPGDGNR